MSGSCVALWKEKRSGTSSAGVCDPIASGPVPVRIGRSCFFGAR